MKINSVATVFVQTTVPGEQAFAVMGNYEQLSPLVVTELKERVRNIFSELGCQERVPSKLNSRLVESSTRWVIVGTFPKPPSAMGQQFLKDLLEERTREEIQNAFGHQAVINLEEEIKDHLGIDDDDAEEEGGDHE